MRKSTSFVTWPRCYINAIVYLHAGSYDRTVRCWDFDSGQCVRIFCGHKRAVFCLVYLQSDSCADSGSDDQSSSEVMHDFCLPFSLGNKRSDTRLTLSRSYCYTVRSAIGNILSFVRLSVHRSVTMCIVALRVGVEGWKLYHRAARSARSIWHFLFTSSDTCCTVYRLAAKHSEQLKLSHQQKTYNMRSRLRFEAIGPK